MAPSVSKIAHALVTFIGLVAAAPQKHNGCEPYTQCVDGINSCGVRYGSCYNVCDEKASPVPPPCAPTHSPTSAHSPTTTSHPTTITTTAVPTLCVDYVNSCGIWYGGCFAYTSPFPTFSDPGCPTTTVKPTTITTPTTTPTSVPTICVDTVNSCGQTYGGCFASTSPYPTFSDPGCPTTTTTPPTTITTTTTAPTSDPLTICADYVNSCGRWYGGCFAYTSPYPSFTDPGCPTTTTPPTIPHPTSFPTICVDTVNSCGMTYGGCFASTSPFPTFTDPGCPTLTTVTVPVPTASWTPSGTSTGL